MHMTSSALTAAILVAASALAPIAAMADNVTIIGCPEPGIQAGCIMMSATGGLYDVSSATPTPQAGVPEQVAGTVATGGTSPCGGGSNVLSPATTTPVDSIVCPDPDLG